jgi:hypothetical protein
MRKMRSKAGMVAAAAGCLVGVQAFAQTRGQGVASVTPIQPSAVYYNGVLVPQNGHGSSTDVPTVVYSTDAPTGFWYWPTPAAILDVCSFTPGPAAGGNVTLTQIDKIAFVLDAGSPGGNVDVTLQFYDTVANNGPGMPANTGPLGGLVRIQFQNIPPNTGTGGAGYVLGAPITLPVGAIHVPDDNFGVLEMCTQANGTTPHPTIVVGWNGTQPQAAGASADFFLYDNNGDGIIDGTETYWFGGPPFYSNLYLSVEADVTVSTTGACCLPDGTCQTLASFQCTQQGGTYEGDNTLCGSVTCPQPGACCLADGTCILTNQAGCDARTGVYRGTGTVCATANCPPPYTEVNDAGDLPATAAVATGSGVLPGIVGNLGTDDTDMYKIQICDAASFKATLVTWSNLDTMMWLFRADGTGVSCDDDSTTLQSTITNLNVTANGTYYLAVSGYERLPLGVTSGGQIWSTFAQDSAPNGPAATEAVGSWQSLVPPPTGAYTIALLGACRVSGSTCYANCDGSTTVPFLNVNDFVCFQGLFAAGNSLANCDHSTSPPVLNISDFVCFQGQFAAGCSAP